MINVKSCKRFWRYQSKRLIKQLPLYTDPVLRSVMMRGLCVIPNYWNKARCDEAISKINLNLENQNSKVWRDQLDSDNRLMGADNLDPALDLVHDQYINSCIESLYGRTDLTKFTMAARLRNVNGNLGSGQGWHRDSPFVYQFKAILYLSDVTSENGPLQYHLGSGSAFSILNMERKFGFSVDKNRFSESDIKQIGNKNVLELCAKAGTLVLANTRGLHRGKPIVSGERYALTNYYWPHAIPEHIEKFVNYESVMDNSVAFS